MPTSEDYASIAATSATSAAASAGTLASALDTVAALVDAASTTVAAIQADAEAIAIAAAASAATSLDGLSDATITSAAQGDVLYRNGSGQWVNLPAGTSGHYLKTQGAGANPVWAAASGGGTADGYTALTFNTSTVSVGGRTMYAATTALPAMSPIGKLFLKGLVYSSAGQNCGVFISPDATNCQGHAFQGNDGNIVHYRNTTAVNALGPSSSRKYGGTKKVETTQRYDGGSWFCSAEFDFERHLNSGDASVASSFTTGSPTFTVYLETDDISKCSLSYRIA